MWPVLLARHAAVPGLDPGDNLAALWNVWWFVHGNGISGWPYWTPLLFSPAEVEFRNLKTGRCHRFGKTEPGLLRKSFGIGE